jgi:hypothetical protein
MAKSASSTTLWSTPGYDNSQVVLHTLWFSRYFDILILSLRIEFYELISFHAKINLQLVLKLHSPCP